MRGRAILAVWLLVFALALTMVPAGNVQGAEWEQLLQKIYPAAKAEGEFVFNSARKEEVGGKEGIAQFQKRFPGIKITFTGIAGSKIASRIITEARAGRVSIDAFRSEPARAEPLASRNLLLAIDPKEITDQSVTTMYNHTFYKIGDHISNFAYNTDLVSKADRPKSYEDLLDPKWKHKLVIDARGGQIAHLLAFGLWKEDRFWNFVRGIKKQEPVWAGRSSEAMAKLAAGEGSVGNGSFTGIFDLRLKGAPVEMLFLSPANSQMRGIAVPKGCPHPNVAKLFLGWVLSPEGIKARDRYGVGTIEPGSTMYEMVSETKAQITFDDTLAKIEARNKVEEQITKEWGILTKKKKKKK